MDRANWASMRGVAAAAAAFGLAACGETSNGTSPASDMPADAAGAPATDPGTAAATPPAPADPVAVLIFSRTAGFRHDSIPAGIESIRGLAAARGWAVEATEDSGAFTDERLAAVDVVVFLSTTGDVLDEGQQGAFERFMSGGGGYVGIHSAADTEYDWAWYGGLVGAYFKGHPPVQDAVVVVEDRDHVSTAHLDERWNRRDEWYDYRANPRHVDGAGADAAGRIRVLASLLVSSYEGSTMGDDHPIAWCQEYEGGRAWYTGGGHTTESFSEAEFLAHIAGGIAWAAGSE